MEREVSLDDTRIQRALKLLEEEENAQRPEKIQALRSSYLNLLYSYIPVMENPTFLDNALDADDSLPPGILARNIKEDLDKYHHATLRLVHPQTLKRTPWKNGKPVGSRLDILATHHKTGYTSVWQFDNRVPTKDTALGVHLYDPPPDLAIFALCNQDPPYKRESLASACRYIKCDFLVVWVDGGKVVLTPAERDILRQGMNNDPPPLEQALV